MQRHTETRDSLSSSDYGLRATGGYTINNDLEEPDLCAMVRCRPRYLDELDISVWLDALDVEDVVFMCSTCMHDTVRTEAGRIQDACLRS